MWYKRGKENTVEKRMEELSGCSIEELLNPQEEKPQSIDGLEAAAEIIDTAIACNQDICIVGDYDADGVTATAILFLLFQKLGKKPHVRLPKRMSEGYGLSKCIIEELKEENFFGLLVTVDNGISAHESIQSAINEGWDVVILDHHLPSEQIPPADVVVDQYLPGHNEHGFQHYCGAGLAFKLAQLMLQNNHDTESEELLKKLCALSAIGTVADVVPLHGDNRVIVQEGLCNINEGCVTGGLQSLLEAKNLAGDIDSTCIGFQIAPLINAAGRLLDDGAKIPCALLATDKAAPKTAQNLVDLNEKRKSLVKEILDLVGPPEMEFGLPYIVMLKKHDKEIEGVLGIIAGSLAEKYGVPTFVMTATDEEMSTWKGSARSFGDINLKERMDMFSETMIRYGGHAGAAGFAVAGGHIDDFVAGARKAFLDLNAGDVGAHYYDLEIEKEKVIETYSTLQHFQPFGAGCEEPIIRINQCCIKTVFNVSLVSFMGNGKHVRIKGDGFDIVWFNHGEDFRAIADKCNYVDVIGRLSVNHSERFGDTLQLVAQDIQPSNQRR